MNLVYHTSTNDRKPYKLLYFYEADAWELYNLSEDIGEDQNIIKKHPKIASNLSKKIQSKSKNIPINFTESNVNW